MKKYYLIIIALILGSNLLKAQLATGSYSDYYREGVFSFNRRKIMIWP